MSPLLALLLLAPAPPSGGVDLEAQVHELVLGNGMRWLVVERHDAPVFSGCLAVRAGGADERPGETGLAHLFEHMAFKGTPVLGTKDWPKERALLPQIAEAGDRLAGLEREGKGGSDEAKAARAKLSQLSQQQKALTDENALATLYLLNGAVGLNASTDKDTTTYYVNLPKNRLELFLTVEAQRLAAPVLRDFYTERDVVEEERKMRIDSEPMGAMFEELTQAAFVSSPYRWPTVGYTGDLEAMTLEAATRFHRKYYVPGNVTGVLVGDLDAAALKPMLEATFGRIPPGPVPPGPQFAEPPQRAEVRSTVYFDASPRWWLAFHKPAPPSHDDDVFDVLQIVLGDGRTSRLYQRLVLKDHLAQSVGTFTAPGGRLPGLFGIAVTPLEGVTEERVQQAVWDELEKLGQQGPTAEELGKARNRITADLARTFSDASSLAAALAHSQAVEGDWRYLAHRPAVISALTAHDVQDVARRYFVHPGSVVVRLERPPKERP